VAPQKTNKNKQAGSLDSNSNERKARGPRTYSSGQNSRKSAFFLRADLRGEERSGTIRKSPEKKEKPSRKIIFFDGRQKFEWRGGGDSPPRKTD